MVRNNENRSSRGERQGSASSPHTPRGATSEAEATLPVVVVGVGAIGRLVAACVLQHAELELVGAADETHGGKPLSELIPGAPDLNPRR